MKRPIDYSRGLSLLFLLSTVSVNDASTPLAFSPKVNENNQLYQPFGRYHEESTGPNSIGNRLLLSRGERALRDTHLPRRAVRSKKIRSPINTDGYSPGRVDLGPAFGKNVESGYFPPTPPAQSASSFTKSAIPTKTNRQPRTNRIRKPFIGDGYVDATDRGRSLQSRGPPGKLDSPNRPNKLPPPLKDNDSEGRRPSPLRLSRPQNPFVNKAPFPTELDSNRRPQGSLYESPSPRPLPDYPQRFDQPMSSAPNSSFLTPSTADFLPFKNKDRPPSKSDPFQFSDVLGGDKNFAFPLSGSFGRHPPRPRPTRDHQPANLFKEFPPRLDKYSPDRQSNLYTDESSKQRYPPTPNYVSSSSNNNNNNINSPRYDTHRESGNRGVPGYNGATYGNRRQCFQYSFPAEAYRLSDIAKDYPREEIQKELDLNPNISPLVGMEAKAATNDPFTFNAPISSHFDFSGFGFKNDATTSDKHSHLKNTKAFPGNMNQGDLVGRFPSSMQPLDSACPTRDYSLRSFFHQGGDCYVINPDFQQITYHRCKRQDCNFCGVNRGLSACVEDYRWVSVMAYCGARPQQKRISPMRLFMPVGCSCQHFVC